MWKASLETEIRVILVGLYCSKYLGHLVQGIKYYNFIKKNGLKRKPFSKIPIYFPPSRSNNPPVILPSPFEPPPGVWGAAANTLLANLLNGSD